MMGVNLTKVRCKHTLNVTINPPLSSYCMVIKRFFYFRVTIPVQWLSLCAVQGIKIFILVCISKVYTINRHDYIMRQKYF
jgi:hypothetical protein